MMRVLPTMFAVGVLELVLRQTAHNGAANSSQKSVSGLLAQEHTGSTTCEGTA